ncbi:MAG: SCO family protein [Chitinophagaceae bacterium]|nr:SCO family protein [Oligoflexus sp.]
MAKKVLLGLVILCALFTTRLHAFPLVIDQNSQTRNFFKDIVGSRQALVIYIYTSCTKVCPVMAKQYRLLEAALQLRSGKEVALIAISMDPEHDSPSDLKDWAAKEGLSDRVTIVTGSRTALNEVTESIAGGGLFDRDTHTPFLFVKDSSGKWRSYYGFMSIDKILELIDN